MRLQPCQQDFRLNGPLIFAWTQSFLYLCSDNVSRKCYESTEWAPKSNYNDCRAIIDPVCTPQSVLHALLQYNTSCRAFCSCCKWELELTAVRFMPCRRNSRTCGITNEQTRFLLWQVGLSKRRLLALARCCWDLLSLWGWANMIVLALCDVTQRAPYLKIRRRTEN